MITYFCKHEGLACSILHASACVHAHRITVSNYMVPASRPGCWRVNEAYLACTQQPAVGLLVYG